MAFGDHRPMSISEALVANQNLRSLFLGLDNSEFPFQKIDDLNRAHFTKCFLYYKKNAKETAMALGITERTVYEWAKRWNLNKRYIPE